MDVKSFKINEVNVSLKILLTKSEAIGICKKGYHKARKEFLKKIAANLLKIDEIQKEVGDDHIPMPMPTLNISQMYKEMNGDQFDSELLEKIKVQENKK
jgi:hypothetical protein